MGGVSIVLYAVMNTLSSGNSVIVDSVSGLGTMIAFYYGLTGFACVWGITAPHWVRAPATCGCAASCRSWVH